METQRMIDALDSFSGQTILVIGDLIIDAYYQGKVNRVSPEAPVSVLDVREKTFRLGGAANVAVNVQGLGARPILVSAVGQDDAGKLAKDLVEKQGMDTSCLVEMPGRITSVKTRLMSDNHQLIRMDEEQTDLLNEAQETALLEMIINTIEAENPSAILFEDYDKGVISASLIAKVIGLARSMNIPVTVDPKKRNFLAYSGATLFKPNLRELRDGLGISDLDSSEESLRKAFDFLCDVMPVDMALFTMASDGASIMDATDYQHTEAHKRNIADVSGAGDTVIATATCALAAGLNMQDICYLANLAGGWVCQYSGVVSISADALKAELIKISAK